MKFKLSLAQTDCALGDENANLAKAQNLIRDAVRTKAQMIVFPEMFLTGYALEGGTKKHAQARDSPILSRVCALAAENRIAISVGYPELERQSGKVYNSSLLVDRDGTAIGIQRKIHLFGKENIYFESGGNIEPFDTSLLRVGIMICYDLYFPENARTLALKQADIIVVPSADWIPFDGFVDKFLPARAAENCVYLAYCNRVGVENEFRFFGKSRVVDPSGNTVCQGTDQEELLTAEVDSALPRQVREEMGFLRDRRPWVYR